MSDDPIVRDLSRKLVEDCKERMQLVATLVDNPDQFEKILLNAVEQLYIDVYASRMVRGNMPERDMWQSMEPLGQRILERRPHIVQLARQLEEAHRRMFGG